MATKPVKDMTPSELCAWLKVQKIDEGCCKLLTETHKIDGARFLRLTKDNLNDPGLGITAWADRESIFEVVTKANQQQEVEHQKLDEAEAIPLCYSYELPDTAEATASQPSFAAGAYVISKDKLWRKKTLKVYFMDDVPNTWKHGEFNDPITKGVILDWAKVWYDDLPANIDGRKHIPKFERTGSIQEADIRVRFKSGENWSMIGTDATKVDSRQPTMTLDLSSSRDDYKRHLVPHEFGHALGLAHEHQSPNAPALLEKEDLIAKLAPYMPGVSEAAKRKAAADKYEQDYKRHSVVADDAVVTKHDPKSIMHYWIPPEWLKDPARHPTGIGLSLPDKPSETDLKTLAQSYKRRAVPDYSEPQNGPAPVSISTIPPPTRAPSGTLVRTEVLIQLLNLLDPMLANWNLFAQQIGVPHTTVTNIETTNARTGPNWISTCFQQALQWWVDNGRNPTYEVIIGVLDPPGGEMTPVMNRRLAGKVREFMREQAGPPAIPQNASAAVQQSEVPGGRIESAGPPIKPDPGNGGVGGHYGSGGMTSGGLQYHSLNDSNRIDVTTYLVGVGSDVIRKLGLVLGIASWRMESINANKMVDFWFQRLDDVEKRCEPTGGLTWESLESAMRHSTVGLVGTANDIKKQKLGL